MNTILKSVLAAAALAFAGQAAAQITFYEREGFVGRSFTTQGQVDYLDDYGFNDRASSVVVVGSVWEVCDDFRFSGRCMVLRPGRYPSLLSMGLENRISSVRIVANPGVAYESRYAPPPEAGAQITFYENEDFRGRSFTTESPVDNLRRVGFNDRSASIDVRGWWEVCDDAVYSGYCVVLRPGRYPSLDSMGLRSRISSVRLADWSARTGEGRSYRRRADERTYEVSVTSVRAVVGPPEQRCWVEREQVRGGANVPGAVAGALIGGILGHQIGHGGGRDLATVGGAVAGGAVGANVGRGGQVQDVQRCTTVPAQAPSYWDVTYQFRGQDYRVQMSAPPGPTIIVNEQGEPRV
jgi:uncharacterized protein YcfJ